MYSFSVAIDFFLQLSKNLFSFCSGHCVHSGSTALYVRRVSSLPDLLKFKQTRKSYTKVCKSEESISSSEYVLPHGVLRSEAPESSLKRLNSHDKSDKKAVRLVLLYFCGSNFKSVPSETLSVTLFSLLSGDGIPPKNHSARIKPNQN